MRIAILTSGGDAPGMNAAVRAVARMDLALGLENLEHHLLIPLLPRATQEVLALEAILADSLLATLE